MSGFPSPEPNWGRDNSDSLILNEQAKSLPKSIAEGGKDTKQADIESQVKEATDLSVAELLARLTDCERDGKTYLETFINPARQRSHKAYRNEHFDKSKYLSGRYATRSKLFKPKTRNAVRKAQAAAAAALFASADVVDVTASDDSNPHQQASAAVNRELLNYRLDRSNGRSSIPWFLVSMGAHQDGLLDGVCASKQYWKWREIQEPVVDEETGEPVMKTIPQTDAMGQPMLDPMTGEPMVIETDDQEIRSIILADRPDSLNIAPENIIFDPACEWTRPAQTSAYLIVRFPMPLRDVMDMMKPGEVGGAAKWIDIDEAELESLAGGTQPSDTQTVRNARSGGADGNQTKQSGKNRPLWVYENFITIKGEDYCFWSVGNQRLLSIPQCTRKAYPPFGGERPYVIGFGAMETHRPLPMAPAESWQQLQQEANDITNLRLDQMKQVVTPVTKVKRGRQIDLEQVFRRGQDTAIMVTDMEDLEWDRPPDVPPSAMAETNVLNNDFDELAGTFSQGSIQSNRQMNETVGGMKLLAGGANSITEFDLRVWVETWVEPVLWQLIRLEQWYESDDKILALAGQKAELSEKFGINEVNDDLLMQDVTVRVSAGIGAADPMQKLEKFAGATKITMEMLGPFIEMGAVKILPKTDEIVNETYGLAGYKGAAERFFEIIPVDPNAPPPEVQAQQAQAQAEAEAMDKQMQAEAEQKGREQAAADDQAQREHAFNSQQADREHQLKIDEATREEQRQVAEHLAAQAAQKRKDEMAHEQALAKIYTDGQKHERDHEQKGRDHEHRTREQETKRHAIDKDHEFKREAHYTSLGVELDKADHDRDQADRHHGDQMEAKAAEAEGGEAKPAGKKAGAKKTVNPAKSFDELREGISQLSQLTAMMAEAIKSLKEPKKITINRGKDGSIQGASVN